MRHPTPLWICRRLLSTACFLSVVVVADAVPARAQDLLVLSRGSQQVLAYDGGDGSFVGPFAKTITEGFRLPGDIAIRPSDGVLYVSSISTGEIWSYTTATGEPLVPAEATGLFAPFGIDFDASGAHLYFADASSEVSLTTDAIYELDVASGVVTTVGSNNQADFLGVAVNGSNVFATDVALDRIIRFPVSGGPGTVVISSGLLEPGALVFASPTQMLVADTGNDRVVEYLESGGSWAFNRVVLPASAGIDEPGGLAIAPDGRLTVSGRQSGDVVLVDLTSLVVTPFVAPGAGGMQDPKGLAWSGSELLVASVAGNAVFYYDGSGAPTGVRASGLSASLDSGIALSDDGTQLYVGSIGGNDIVEFDVATGARTRIFSQACPTFPFPFDVAIGPDDDLYVSCILNSSVEQFDRTTGAALGNFVLAGSGGLVSPRGLAFGPNGNLFVSSGSDEILEYNGVTGAYVGVFVDVTGNSGGPIDPYALRFHDGVLYTASFLYDEVKAFDASTGAFESTFVTSGSGGLTGPTALDFGPDGDLFVTSSSDDTIRRYDGATGAFVGVFVPAGSGGLDDPFDLAFLPTAALVPALAPVGSLLLCAALAGVAARTLRHRIDEMENGA